MLRHHFSGSYKLRLKSQLQESDVVSIIDYLPEDGKAYFKAALGMGLEGITAKRLAPLTSRG